MLYLKKLYKNLCQNEWLAFIIFLGIMIFFHKLINLDYGDDIALSMKWNTKTLKEFIIWDYVNWGSRIFVDSTVIILLRLSSIIWKLLNIFMLLLLFYSLSYLFAEFNRKQCNYLIFMLILVYPLLDMSTAGWLTTTVTYLWTLVLGIFSFISLKKILENKKIFWWEYILYSIAILYASNQEQMLIILLVTYFLFSIYMLIFKKSKNWFILIEVSICLGNLVFNLTTPGNVNRKLVEASVRMPDFFILDFIDKAYLGFMSTVSHFIKKPNFIFIIFLILISIAIYSKYRNWFYRGIATIPLAVTLCLGIFKNIILYLFPNLNTFYVSEKISVDNYLAIKTYFPFILYIFLIGCIVLSIYLLFENTVDTIFIIFVLALGLVSRIVLGFSPTLYASGTRTYIHIFFSFIICIIYIYSRLSSEEIISFKSSYVLFNIIFWIMAFCFINSVYGIHSL